MTALRALILGDAAAAASVAEALAAAGRPAETTRAATTAALERELDGPSWDVVVLAGGDRGRAVAAVRAADAHVAIVALGGVAGTGDGVRLLPATVGPAELADAVATAIDDAAARRAAAGLPPELALRALAAAGNGVAIADASQRGFPVVHVNAAFARLTGYAPEELLGRSCRRLQAPGTDPRAVADLAAALRIGAPWKGTLLNARRDGSTFWNELTLSPVFGPDGIRTHVVAVARDVSEQIATADRLAAAETRYGRVIDDLAAAEHRYRELVERIPAVVYVADFDARFTLRYVSPRIETLLGHPPEAFLADQGLWYRLVHRDDRARLERTKAGAFADEETIDCEYRMLAADGRELWVWERDEIVRDESGRPLFSQGVLVDITAQRRAEESLRAERDRAQRYLDLAGMVVLVLDADERIALLNRAGHQLLAQPDGALLGRNWFDTCVPEAEREEARARFRGLLAGTDDPTAEGHESTVVDAEGVERIVRWNHTVLHDESGAATATLSSGVDVTARRRAEQQIAYLAYHDPLTGLPNRALLREHLELAIARAERNGAAVAVLYVDLDDFKLVNDSLGHAAGDELLVRVALGLRQRTRAADLLARQGGDEFLLLLTDLDVETAESAAQAAASSVMAAMADPFQIAGAEFHVGASVGISLYPRDADGAEELLKHADAAMYQAKASGRGEVVVFDGDPRAAIERLSLSTRLRRAIASDELVLHWQPIVALADGSVTAVEALVRWHDPDRGLLLPDAFVPFAEDTGLIDRLGVWVAEAVSVQRQRWAAAGVDLPVHLNVSPRQMVRPERVLEMVDRLRDGGVDLSTITLEITESMALADDGRAAPLLHDLHETGVRLAIDDFGAGWSSLGRLRDLPVQVVKIDRSFLAGVPREEGPSAIVSAMLTLVDALGMDAVAEGVEDESQRLFLAELGCPAGQGYLLGRPLPADELDGRLSSLAST
ncbi:MAG TPA: EAL domain-containing protein [Capillimicrobium sp.]|nr:EAL domain-containing protein [Capillimicrobium sp.]